ncbi:response regulator [Teredinibacter franksiae]|uniref:response regulator n=1 Tax=Teredinibacter franksiae TaxID=2761453 RepID=UPI001628C11A|nr:response regulator transcription factor [Teredinibacter franksiae]
MTRIALVDDQVLIREGIARLIELEETFDVIWQASNGQEALDKLAGFGVPNIIISDIRMPVLDGIQLVKALRAQACIIPVLMLTTFDEHELFVSALNAGANGFLLKDINFEKLCLAIHTISEGGFLAEPQLLNRELLPDNGIATIPKNFNFEDFSEKEKQILRYLAAGFSNKEIASSVFLAEGTVKNHISNILGKLDCRDRTQAVIKALQWRLI